MFACVQTNLAGIRHDKKIILQNENGTRVPVPHSYMYICTLSLQCMHSFISAIPPYTYLPPLIRLQRMVIQSIVILMFSNHGSKLGTVHHSPFPKFCEELVHFRHFDLLFFKIVRLWWWRILIVPARLIRGRTSRWDTFTICNRESKYYTRTEETSGKKCRQCDVLWPLVYSLADFRFSLALKDKSHFGGSVTQPHAIQPRSQNEVCRLRVTQCSKQTPDKSCSTQNKTVAANK